MEKLDEETSQQIVEISRINNPSCEEMKEH